jgi:hypothetical protein
MLVEDSRSTRDVMLRATAKDMIRGAAKHATVESDGVGTLEVGERIGETLGSPASGGTSLHRSFSRGEEYTSGSNDVVVWWESLLNGKGSSKGGSGALLQFAKDCFSDELLLGTKLGVMTDGGDAKDAQGVKLRGTRNKSGQIWGGIRIVSSQHIVFKSRCWQTQTRQFLQFESNEAANRVWDHFLP